MSLRGKLLLRNDDLVADGAVLALRLAGLGTGGLNCRVDDLGMSLRGNLLHAGENCVTLQALSTGFVPGLSAGCGLFSNINGSMPGCIKCLGLGFVANGTSVRPDTRVFAGGCSRDLAVIPTVSRCRNLRLLDQHLVTDRAVLALGQSGLRAGSSDCLVDDLGVSLRGNLFLCNKNLVADGAVLALGQSGLRAGGSDCRVDDLGVPLCGNHFLSNKNLVADGAVLAFRLAGLGTGGLNCRVDDLGVSLRGNLLHAGENCVTLRALGTGFVSGLSAGCRLFSNINGSMTSSINRFGSGCVADRAGVSHDTGVFTGRSGRDLAVIPTVSLRGNLCLCHENLIADRAVLALGLTGFCAGGGDCRVDDLGVPLCGNHFTAADLITALLAVGIAGVTGSGTGGVLRIANLRIGMAACNSKLCSVRGVAGNSSNGLIPAAKRIGVHAVIRTGRCHAAIDGRRSIFLCRAIQLRAVPVQPPDCVGAQFLLIHGSILRVAHYRNRLRCPADKAIGILRISRPGRCSVIGWNRSIVHRACPQNGAIPIFPGDGSLIGGRVNHTSLLVKAVTTLLHQAIGRFYPIGAVLDHGTAGLVLEIVVVAFHVAQAGLNIFNTVLYPIDIAIPWVETVHMLLQNAVCAKHVDNIFATFVHGVKTGSSVFAGSEVIPVSVHGVPLLRGPGTCPHILGSRAVSDQITANQDTVFECVVIVADGLLSVHSGIAPCIEEVILYSTAGMRD